MVLILTSSFNITVQNIIDSFIRNNIRFIRINIDSFITYDEEYEIEIIDGKIILNKVNIEEYENVMVWKVYFEHFADLILSKFPKIPTNLALYKANEWIMFFEYLLDRIKDKIIFGYHKDDINKLEQLFVCKKIGFSYPDFWVNSQISSEKITLLNLKNKIIKPINFPYNNLGKKSFITYASRIKKFQKEYFPFMLQEKINYIYEIRIFYFNKRYYPARLVPHCKYRLVDYRLHNNYHFIPIKMDESLKIKLNKFVKYFNLKTASFDFLFDGKNYIFLESNPTGNFIKLIKDCEYSIFDDINKVIKKNEA